MENEKESPNHTHAYIWLVIICIVLSTCGDPQKIKMLDQRIHKLEQEIQFLKADSTTVK